ncbi:P1 family peptidase [Phototrophicus methaneseepsis]|uniref:P1 family peptidase n=1 Tax=Phototrophicus methaneseepsis TaxID=2710758 RepID=A0A7S8E8R9_9CHLR|nr:P1 family peptidase [Phototrophicus methaneseepsis]QPC82339.1 P1 family peptidase [Phototrophicus methaneseepsis]
MSYNHRSHAFDLSVGTLESGPLNAITDVAGVHVGHKTRIEGDDTRTGVTAILPHTGHLYHDPVTAAVYTINGFGKAVGFEQVRELGILETPILLTNTLSTWRAADALVTYMLRQSPDIWTVNPVVGECNDSYLNDIKARVITPEDAFAALDSASDGPVTEGCVGAGTGTSCYGFKGGIGTSSRVVGEYTVGALLQTNFGSREELRMNGIPVGWHLRDQYKAGKAPGPGSVMIILATDAPLTARQLQRLAKRAAFGLGRTGTACHHGSGDFVIAFSTQRAQTIQLDHVIMDPLFSAVVDCVENAVYNALLAATTITGREGNTLYALPHDDVRRLLQLETSRRAD